jgi:outer membrane protein assembly factor BamB
MVTPLVVNGILYTITNWHRVYALNAENGVVVWYRDLPLLLNYSSYLQPSIPGQLGVPLGHYHAITYTNNIREKGLVWVVTNTDQIIALDALTGDIIFDLNPMKQNAVTGIIGNYGLYDVDTPNLLIDGRRGIVVFSPSVSEGAASGRGYLQAWNVTGKTPLSIWQTFVIPPQNGKEPLWSIDSVGNMTHAYVFNGTSALDLKSLPYQQLRSILFADWGNFGFNGTMSFAGASASWGGSWALDERKGIAYVSTNAPGPIWNATFRPGPDLWSSSVIALNVTNGRLIWGFQAMPHSLSDFDCSWNVMLANSTIGGVYQQMIYKGCKNGYVFALNADTGRLAWYFKPPSVPYLNTEFFDPRNNTQMAKFNWFGYPSVKPVLENPPDTGSLESDLAFDPIKGTIVVVPYNQPKTFTPMDVPPVPGKHVNLTEWEFAWGTSIFAILPHGSANATVYELDASSGKIRWSYPILDQPYRGGVTISGGVVYISTLDGVLRMLDEDSGKLLSSMNIGGSLLVQPSVASDASGNTLIFLTDMGSSRWGPVFPGFIQAIAPAKPATSVSVQEIVTYALAGVGVVSILYGGFILLSKKGRKKPFRGS